MDLSVSLCIAASFAILCTFYIGKSILVMDFSEYLPKNLKKAKMERLLAKGKLLYRIRKSERI